MIKKQYTIVAVTGFARSAVLLVHVAYKFKSVIFLDYRGRSVNLKNSTKSTMEIMSLGICPGDQISIRAEGIDEDEALQSIGNCLNKKKLTEEWSNLPTNDGR